MWYQTVPLERELGVLRSDAKNGMELLMVAVCFDGELSNCRTVLALNKDTIISCLLQQADSLLPGVAGQG